MQPKSASAVLGQRQKPHRNLTVELPLSLLSVPFYLWLVGGRWLGCSLRHSWGDFLLPFPRSLTESVVFVAVREEGGEEDERSDLISICFRDHWQLRGREDGQVCASLCACVCKNAPPPQKKNLLVQLEENPIVNHTVQ